MLVPPVRSSMEGSGTVIEFEALDALLVPITFVAVTVNVYDALIVNPATDIEPEPA